MAAYWHDVGAARGSGGLATVWKAQSARGAHTPYEYAARVSWKLSNSAGHGEARAKLIELPWGQRGGGTGGGTRDELRGRGGTVPKGRSPPPNHPRVCDRATPLAWRACLLCVLAVCAPSAKAC